MSTTTTIGCAEPYRYWSAALVGSSMPHFLTADFSQFLTQLVNLHDSLNGKAEFQTLEEQLFLELKGDGKGHINIRGEAMDMAGIGNRLIFNILIDQTQFRMSISQLKKITSHFPIRSAN